MHTLTRLITFLFFTAIGDYLGKIILIKFCYKLSELLVSIYILRDYVLGRACEGGAKVKILVRDSGSWKATHETTSY